MENEDMSLVVRYRLLWALAAFSCSSPTQTGPDGVVDEDLDLADTGDEMNTDDHTDTDEQVDPDDPDDPVDTDTVVALSCTAPATFDRIDHDEGVVDFHHVAWSPNGDYALVLGGLAELYRFEVSSQTLTLVDSEGGERWTAIDFNAESGEAYVVGGTSGASLSPVMYRYTESAGLETVDTVMISSTEIRAIDYDSNDGSFLLLSNTASGGGGYRSAFVHRYTPGLTLETGDWAFVGGTTILQQGRAISAGLVDSKPVALAVSNETDLMWVDEASTHKLTLQSHGNTGNFGDVLFDATSGVAWVTQWSGGGVVYPWDQVLQTDGSATINLGGIHGSLWALAASSDSTWKGMVGRGGTVWFSDSPFVPLDSSKFYYNSIPGFSGTPWFGTSNDYLMDIAFRPDRCEGLIVGDAIGGSGLIASFSL